MDITKITFRGIRINKIEYDVENLYELSETQVGLKFSLGINTDDSSLLRVDGVTDFMDIGSENRFLSIAHSTLFETDNTNLELDFSDLDRDYKNKIISLIFENLSPVIENITKNSFENAVKLNGIEFPLKKS